MPDAKHTELQRAAQQAQPARSVQHRHSRRGAQHPGRAQLRGAEAARSQPDPGVDGHADAEALNLLFDVSAQQLQAEHSAGRAVIAMVYRQERGMTMAQQIAATLGSPSRASRCGRLALPLVPGAWCQVRRLRAGDLFERARAARLNVSDLGAKHSHSLAYGEHLQRRADAFKREERAWASQSQALSRAAASPSSPPPPARPATRPRSAARAPGWPT